MNWIDVILAVWLAGLTFVVWWMLYGKVFPRIARIYQSSYNYKMAVGERLYSAENRLTALERKEEEVEK